MWDEASMCREGVGEMAGDDASHPRKGAKWTMSKPSAAVGSSSGFSMPPKSSSHPRGTEDGHGVVEPMKRVMGPLYGPSLPSVIEIDDDRGVAGKVVAGEHSYLEFLGSIWMTKEDLR